MKEKENCLIEIVSKISKEVNNNRTSESVFLSVAEEVGELAKELRVKYKPDCYKTGDEDGILGEGCDILIGVIDLLVLEGFSKEIIEKTVKIKLAKWQDKVNKNKGSENNEKNQ